MSKISTKNYSAQGTGWYNFDSRIDAGLSFFTSSDGVLDERLTLTDLGKVGINNTSPSATLDIKSIDASSSDSKEIIFNVMSNPTGGGILIIYFR